MRGFGGQEIAASEDVPIGAGRHYDKNSMSDRLSKYLYGRYELVSFEPRVQKVDPVVLRNQWHQIVYQWPDGYIPDWVDVLNVSNQLGLK